MAADVDAVAAIVHSARNPPDDAVGLENHREHPAGVKKLGSGCQPGRPGTGNHRNLHLIPGQAVRIFVDVSWQFHSGGSLGETKVQKICNPP